MTSETIIAVVTIICGCVVTVVSLLVRADVIGLRKTVGDQTVELAKLHQTITAQSARIYDQKADITDLEQLKAKGRPAHTEPREQPYKSNKPFRRGE